MKYGYIIFLNIFYDYKSFIKQKYIILAGKKNPGAFLVVVSTGDTRTGKIYYVRITLLLC